MKIGDLSRRTGVSIRMLRYYEEEGLLTPQRRDSGYRDYGPQEEESVKFIKILGATGMTLPTIAKFLPCTLKDRPSFEPCHELIDTLQDQIEATDGNINKLMEGKKLLENILSDLKRTIK
ncbi:MULTISPECIES: MerR family transcriptional regulator [unclassified Azospirillum]|uniref:MerR family transcriptional regulator n=1 Tax=unclassified Azospirillum TaxID=2630922 RepID=UPI000B6EDE51|nr:MULTISPECIES: MerR family transcriptional regulator [unclassified Azospirillum]SNT00309.1 DNA-binding transcriptional regulator, MerR family [Azospirillum sp. RU38E]SNT16327.1 DNA-binding transcriptional regulator, MerR family [Azospirillum sp. RU37A]